MGALEDQFEAAVSESDIPGAVLVASDAKGTPPRNPELKSETAK